MYLFLILSMYLFAGYGLTPRNSKMPSYLLENCLNMRACFFFISIPRLKSRIFQGCVRYIFASLFFMSKREDL